jgi:dihydrolipoamide dehydrogenase
MTVAGSSPNKTEVLVLGGGPGGYTAAFRAADLGKAVVLVERWPTLGGVCLNVGCIPSKALLHAARLLAEMNEMDGEGLDLAPAVIDVGKLRKWKDGVATKLTTGLAGLARRRKVTVVRGVGGFVSSHQAEVASEDGSRSVI